MNLKTILTLAVVCAASSATLAQTYTGTVSCSQSLSAAARPGFELPAELIVKNGVARMKRSSDKYEELLEGRLSGQQLSLEGQGKNFAGGDPWTTKLQGTVDGRTFKGKGEILTSKGEKYRDCQVSMVNTTKPVEQVASVAAPTPLQAPAAQKAVADSPVVASFDCQKASSKTEKMICSSPQTAKLDVALSNAYRKTLAASDNQNEVKAEQMTWLSSVRSKCESTDCLDSAYAARIKAIEERGSNPVPIAPVATSTTEPPVAASTPKAEESKPTTQEPVVTQPKIEAPVADAKPIEKPVSTGLSKDTKQNLALAGVIAVTVLLTCLVVGFVIYWFRVKYPKLKAKEEANRKAKQSPSASPKTMPTDKRVQEAALTPNSTAAAAILPTKASTTAELSSEPPATYQVKIAGYKTNELPELVRQRLQALLKANPTQVEQLLAMPEYVLKKGMTQEQARIYQKAILSAGANCDIEIEPKEINLDVDLPSPVQPASNEIPHQSPSKQDAKMQSNYASGAENVQAIDGLSEKPEWFYEQEGKRLGPISEVAVAALVRSKQLDAKSSVWKQGLAGWQPLESTGLAEHLDKSAPPPLMGHQVNNTIVWILAFAPVIGELLQWVIAGFIYKNQYLTAVAMQSGKFFYVTIIINVVLGLLDERKLHGAGHDTSKYKIWAWLLVPVYLFQRAKHLQQNLAYFIVWLVCFFAVLIGI
jgi:uncharacterized protein